MLISKILKMILPIRIFGDTSLFLSICQSIIIPAFSEMFDMWGGVYKIDDDRMELEIISGDYLILFTFNEMYTCMEICPKTHIKGTMSGESLKIIDGVTNLKLEISEEDEQLILRCINRIDLISNKITSEIGKNVYTSYKESGMFDDINKNKDKNDGE